MGVDKDRVKPDRQIQMDGDDPIIDAQGAVSGNRSFGEIALMVGIRDMQGRFELLEKELLPAQALGLEYCAGDAV